MTMTPISEHEARALVHMTIQNNNGRGVGLAGLYDGVPGDTAYRLLDSGITFRHETDVRGQPTGITALHVTQDAGLGTIVMYIRHAPAVENPWYNALGLPVEIEQADA